MARKRARSPENEDSLPSSRTSGKKSTPKGKPTTAASSSSTAASDQWWLMKTEPSCYSISDLEREKITPWDGVRNYQARNNMRSMKAGDNVFIYHSNAGKETGVVGLGKVSKEAYTDSSAFDPKHKNYDPQSDPVNPRWQHVDVSYVKTLKRPALLSQLKKTKGLESMKLFTQGRLSVSPVTAEEASIVLGLEAKKA